MESSKDKPSADGEELMVISAKSGYNDASTEEKSHAEETININIEDENGQQEDKIKVPSRLNENIYNAFLVLNYRQDLNFNDIDVHNYTTNLKISLGIVSYIIFFAQWAALILLMRIIMISSDNSFADWFHGESKYYSYFLSPFLVFAMITTAKEFSQYLNDWWILREWKMRRCLKTHIFFLKDCGGQLLGCFGGAAYFAVLTIYSKTERWDDILNVILNLLAYQFILDADEWAYEYFAKSRIECYVARASSDGSVVDIFSGYHIINRKPSFKASYNIYYHIVGNFFLCLVFQALLSNNKSLVGYLLLIYAISSIVTVSIYLFDRWRTQRQHIRRL